MDDIESLINQIDDEDSSLDDAMEHSKEHFEESQSSNDKHDEYDPLDELEGLDDDVDDSSALRPIEVIKHMPNNDSSSVSVSESAIPVDVVEYKQKLDAITEEVIDACRSDRQEVQVVISDLRDRLEEMKNPNKALIDGIVKALEVKTNINQNAIRIMDTNAKFLSSIKSTMNIDNNISVDAKELERILS